MDNRVEPYLIGGDLVVDVGCGNGEALDSVYVRYRRALGIDINTERYSSRTQARTWTFMLADLNRGFPLTSGSADVVHANQVIEHVANPLFFMTEAQRVLKPGGRLLVTTPNIAYLAHVWRLVVLGHGPITSSTASRTVEDWDSGHVHFFTTTDLAWIARQAGFASITTSALPDRAGRASTVRRLLDRWRESEPVKRYLSGNILLVGTKAASEMAAAA